MKTEWLGWLGWKYSKLLFSVLSVPLSNEILKHGVNIYFPLAIQNRETWSHCTWPIDPRNEACTNQPIAMKKRNIMICCTIELQTNLLKEKEGLTLHQIFCFTDLRVHALHHAQRVHSRAHWGASHTLNSVKGWRNRSQQKVTSLI